jgi:hypothetical protein
MTLSGGERQRISIARAFLKNAPILILDEPTSSVDLKTEATIMDAMERLMEGRTTFMIAHRLSTLEGCDLRLEIRDGHAISAAPARTREQNGWRPSAPARSPVRRRETRRSSRRVGHFDSLPVVRAWQQLTGGDDVFSTVEVLKESKGSQVYRLRGGSPELDVIAKRRRCEKLQPERAVYEHLLAALPVEPVRYFGHVPAAESGFGWLFIEYVDGDPLRPSDERHLAALADYLAAVHGGAAFLPELDGLPARNLSFFYAQIDAACALIRTGFENATIGHRDREVLMAHLGLLENFQSRWDATVGGLDGMPRTLVHCDVIASNTRVVPASGDPRLVVFDWEYCGVGCTAPDLAGLAGHPAILRRYSDGLRLYWPDLSFADVQRLADVGTVLRFILAISWAGASLRYAHPHRSLRRLARYRDPLENALQRVG